MKRVPRPALLFAGALAIRLAHLAAIRDSPLANLLLIDSKYYDEFGRRLASGGGLPEGPFFMNVLYGFVMGAAYALAGEGARIAVPAVQAILGSLACVLLAAIGRRAERPREGWAAGIALAVYGPAIFYDAALLTPSILLFLTTLATWLALDPAPGRRSGAAALGAASGLLILGRANHALLALAYAARLVVRRRALAAVLLAGTAALVVVPVTLRNLAESGELVPVTANGGMALWAGNHEAANGIYSEPAFLTNPVPEREAADYREEASRRAGRPLTLAESSAFWTRATLQRWASDPGAASRLVLRKLRIYLHAVESQTNLSYYFAIDFSPVLQVFRVHWGWILPFALVGLVREGRRLAVVALPIAVSLATCLAFYVSSEYRHPVVPCFLLFAAAGAFDLARAFRRTGPLARAGIAALVVALLAFANAPDPLLARLTTRRVDYHNFAALALDAGDVALAESLVRRSIAIDPAWEPSRRRLAEILARAGRTGEAAEEGAMAARLGGDEEPVLEAMRRGAELFDAGRFEEARAYFLALASSGRAPAASGRERAAALNNAALAAQRLGAAAQADSLLGASIAADSTYASPWLHRGRFALAGGDSAAARRFAARALELAPEDDRALRLADRAGAR